MELQARLVEVLPVQSGISQAGRAWKKQSFVVETIDSQYPKKVCFTLFGEDKTDVSSLPINSVLNVSFDLSSREFNGKWYTDAQAWRVSVASDVQSTSQAAPMAQPTAPVAPTPQFTEANEADDLPF